MLTNECVDVLATLAQRFAGEDLNVVIISRDKDLDQLIDDGPPAPPGIGIM